MDDFYKYYWHDGDIEKVEIISNQIMIMVLLDDYPDPITIVCHKVVGLTDLCMWEDTIINDATLEIVNHELSPFLQQVKKAHLLEGSIYDNNPIMNDLLCLSIKLVNDIVFHIYCYDVEVINPVSPMI